MIDQILVSPELHMGIGILVLLSIVLALSVCTWQAWRRQALSRLGHGALIIVQVVLMVQALVGIKLLDQGLGVVQLYIHYLGGLAPLLFLVVLYWFPWRSDRWRAWTTVGALVAGLAFALLTFGVGQYYVNNSPLGT